MAMSKKNMQTVKMALQQCDTEQLMELSNELRGLYRAAVRIESAKKQRQMRIGGRVQFKQGLRPGYLSGETGVITEFRTTRLVITLDRGPLGKFKNGRVVTTGLSLILLEGNADADS
jgi:hypothetical protein